MTHGGGTKLIGTSISGPKATRQQGGGAGYAASQTRGVVLRNLRPHQAVVASLPPLGEFSCQGEARAHAVSRAKEKLELVHGDPYGPVTPATPRGWRFFLLLVDDVSHYM